MTFIAMLLSIAWASRGISALIHGDTAWTPFFALIAGVVSAAQFAWVIFTEDRS